MSEPSDDREPTIPPPSEADMLIDLVKVYEGWGLFRKVIRRCHAAESERDRLAARLKRAEELLEPFRTHVGGCSDAMCPNCRIYRYFAESIPTEKQS